MTGFTLVELMAVLAVAAVLAGGAAPSMTGLVRSIQLSSASNDLLGGLLLARTEAMKRGGRVVLCKTPDGTACADTGGWEQGWMVFHDKNNNGTREESEAVIHHVQALTQGLRATGNLSVARYVSYAPSGATKLVSGGFQAGTLTLCRQSDSAGDARQIILAAGGRPRVQKLTVPSCG